MIHVKRTLSMRLFSICTCIDQCAFDIGFKSQIFLLFILFLLLFMSLIALLVLFTGPIILFQFTILLTKSFQFQLNKLFPKFLFDKYYFYQLILLFSLFLLLFMSLTVLFGTIYGYHCIISANFYLYLQYFQQKIFNYSKISRSQTFTFILGSNHITYLN